MYFDAKVQQTSKSQQIMVNAKIHGTRQSPRSLWIPWICAVPNDSNM